ncbi:MAG: ABC transporter permease [Candidatus Atribacteria bacterium]|nr:ABC transporter permease [Candidatus Atribacteria bacterium]
MANNNGILKILKNRELLVMAFLLIIFFSITSNRFLSPSNISNVLMNISVSGILALGLALVMINGDFDLSFGSALGLLNLFILMFVDKGWNVWVMFALAIVGGILWGMLNAILVVQIKIHAFVATIATWTMCRGFIYWINGGKTFYGKYPDFMTIIGRGTVFGYIPISSIIFIGAAIIVFLLANRSKFGRYIYAVGSNADAAEYVGINSKRIRFTSYLLQGLLIGLSTVILSSKLTSGPATAGDGFQMTVIASAFLGATVFKPGLVNIGGSILGILLLSIIENGLIMLGVPFYFKYIVQGLIIIGAVSFISLKNKRSEGPAIL